MSEPVTDEKTRSPEDAKTNSLEDTNVVAHRVLLIADDGANMDDSASADGDANAVDGENADGAKVDDGAESLREKIAAAGFEVARATAEEAARRVEEFAPEVVLIAFGGREGEGRLVTLARRLRSEPKTFALPVVRSEEHTSELQSRQYHVCRLPLEKQNIAPANNRLARRPDSLTTVVVTPGYSRC